MPGSESDDRLPVVGSARFFRYRRNMRGRVWVDGVEVTPEAGHVSAFDRGFAYGDAVFEVLRVYGGRVPAWADHLGRLEAGARALGIAGPERSVWAADLRRVLDALGPHDAYLRIVLTRGEGLGVVPPARLDATRVLVARTIAPGRPSPVKARLVSGAHARGGDARFKTAGYLGPILAARQAAPDEALLVDARGLVTEAASSNVFVVVAGLLMTPPDDGHILPGITRARVLELARSLGLRTLENPIGAATLGGADEVFLTASVRELVPVGAVDGRPVAAAPGPVYLALRRAYERWARGG